MIEFEIPKRIMSKENLLIFDMARDFRIVMEKSCITIELMDYGKVISAWFRFNILNDVGVKTVAWFTSDDFTKTLAKHKKADKTNISYDEHNRKLFFKSKGINHDISAVTPDEYHAFTQFDGEMVENDIYNMYKSIRDQCEIDVKIKCDSTEWLKEIAEDALTYDERINIKMGLNVSAIASKGSMEINIKEAYSQLEIIGDLHNNKTYFSNRMLILASKLDLDEYHVDFGTEKPIQIWGKSEDAFTAWICVAPCSEDDNIGGV